MVRRMILIASLATPFIAALAWIWAYNVAISQMSSPPCCEDAMDMLPVGVVLTAVPVLAVAALLGLAAAYLGDAPKARLIVVTVATGITCLLVAVWFAAAPLTTPEWPLTPVTVSVLIIGALVTILPWTGALAVSVRGRRDARRTARATGGT